VTRRIIIPASGDALRFGGLPKELLPISDVDCSLTYAVRTAQALGGVAVITSNPHKEYFHRAALKRAGLDCEIIVRTNYQHKDLWGSIERGLEPGRAGALILADTVSAWDFDKLPEDYDPLKTDLAFGTFETKQPERFSVIIGCHIATKEMPVAPVAGYGDRAWGTIFWSAAVTDFLLGLEISHYDRAFEAAMKEFKWSTFPLKFYYDLGTFPAYAAFLITEMNLLLDGAASSRIQTLK
jgi:hypothetical protein